MIETLGARQQELLKLLLENKAGLTVEELSQALAISRNAVRQHLAGMERDGLLLQSGTRPTGGRPEQLYLLTDRGREACRTTRPEMSTKIALVLVVFWVLVLTKLKNKIFQKQIRA